MAATVDGDAQEKDISSQLRQNRFKPFSRQQRADTLHYSYIGGQIAITSV
jgi:hypothetical protein